MYLEYFYKNTISMFDTTEKEVALSVRDNTVFDTF